MILDGKINPVMRTTVLADLPEKVLIAVDKGDPPAKIQTAEVLESCTSSRNSDVNTPPARNYPPIANPAMYGPGPRNLASSRHHASSFLVNKKIKTKPKDKKVLKKEEKEREREKEDGNKENDDDSGIPQPTGMGLSFAKHLLTVLRFQLYIRI